MLYALRQPGAVKFGFTSSDPERRLRELQTGSAAPLSLQTVCPGTLRQEQHLHYLLRRLLPDRHQRIGEWYGECDLIVQTVLHMRSCRLTPWLVELERRVVLRDYPRATREPVSQSPPAAPAPPAETVRPVPDDFDVEVLRGMGPRDAERFLRKTYSRTAAKRFLSQHGKRIPEFRNAS